MRFVTAVAAMTSVWALALPAAAQETAFDPARLDQHIRTLSADDYQGRGIATPAEERVIGYMAGAMAAAGLEPGGENGGWTQAVALNRFSASNIQAALSVGDWTLPLTQGEQAVISTRRPGLDQVTVADAPLVFVGYGIKAAERNWDDFKGQDMTGKILVVLVNDADFEEPGLDTFGGRAMTYYGRWTYKYEEAARLGAAGVIIVHEDAPASYGWTTVRNSWSGPQFDIVRDNANERVPVESWIQRDVAVELFRRAGLDFDALKVQARSRDFQPVPLTGATMDATFDVASERIETQNIIGRLPGTTHPDETILFTGHWDHIGVGTADADGDAIFNGAVDNASGIAGLLELARIAGAAPRTERSLVFIGFTAEESGLLGSEYYAANPLYPLETTVGGFNMDSANVYGRTRHLGVIGYGQSDFDARLETVAAAQGRTLEPDQSTQAGFYFRSDHFPLAKRGVPMVYADSSGAFVDEPIAERTAARAEYTADRYHQANDEWSADWDYRGQIQDLEVYWTIARDLANGRDWPQWQPTSEFATARATSAAARD
ncbi:M28 family metallopeptidase [Brevundimonas aurifodinae]|uniref:M28 family metallopeptidase n=2 Tax=Brevundimonas TaxID=41275 RepID=A0ABV1NP76_9CAUL|nr:MAG: peptidase M20 [Brevundimonas sp. 12-68-7]OYX35876.1 MAG: peptidase M20 [Brevundimonas subvibrioides]